MTDDFLLSLTKRFGTPLYVYDLDVVSERIAQLRAAFGNEAKLFYAMKANRLSHVLRHVHAHGMGAEVLTIGELESALHAGIPASNILLGGPGHTPELVQRAIQVGVELVSIDSTSVYSLWKDAPFAGKFLLRVNPGFDPGTHPHLATAAEDSKFGLTLSEAHDLAKHLHPAEQLAGFHIHAGSMIRDTAVTAAVVEVLTNFYETYPGLPLVDFGGGFAIPDGPVAAVGHIVQPFIDRFQVTPIFEPGRFVIGEAGQLLTTVLHVKDGAKRHVIADAGMADLLRPALYDAVHPIAVLGKELASDTLADIDGPLCENGDRLGIDRELGDVEPGDVLAVEFAGAYGFAMSSNYVAHLRAAEVVVQGGEAKLARRRETPDDLWRLEVVDD